MKKYTSYENARKYLKDKDLNVNSYIDYMLARTAEMFIYKNLPETIPADKLEYLLQNNGECFITKVDGKLYALKGSAGGEPNAYDESTRFVVANAALKLSKDFIIDTDGVLMVNDSRKIGLIPILSKYGAMLCDSEISLNMVSVLMRVCYLISANDDKTKASADLFINKIINGDYSVISDSAFFEGVKIQNAHSANSQLIQQFIELNQYIKASAFNEIGLNANFNMKRERLTESEVELNTSALIPFTENMLNCRRAAIEKINKMFNTEIEVDLSGVWKAEKEQLEQQTAEVNTTSITDAENAPAEINGGKKDVVIETTSETEKTAASDSESDSETVKTSTGEDVETVKTSTGEDVEKDIKKTESDETADDEKNKK